MDRLFARQRAKATRPSGEVDIDVLETLVAAAYEQAERDRRRTDRSIRLMAEELDELNRRLERLVEERTTALRNREAELQAQNLRFDAAINNMSQALLMFDSEARLVICNQRYIEMYHLSPDIVLPGRHLQEILRHRLSKGTFSGDRQPSDGERRLGRHP
jgi:PAS domain-containing protein